MKKNKTLQYIIILDTKRDLWFGCTNPNTSIKNNLLTITPGPKKMIFIYLKINFYNFKLFWYIDIKNKFLKIKNILNWCIFK